MNTAPIYRIGDRIRHRHFTGTVVAVRTVTSDSTRNPLPDYQRITMDTDAEFTVLQRVEGGAHHFSPAPCMDLVDAVTPFRHLLEYGETIHAPEYAARIAQHYDVQTGDPRTRQAYLTILAQAPEVVFTKATRYLAPGQAPVTDLRPLQDLYATR